MRILCIGDIVGRPGRRALAQALPDLRTTENIDFVIANGENAAAGSGLTPKVLQSLLDCGCDVVTSGDHIYKNKDVMGCIGHDQLLRPANYVAAAAGRGAGIFTAPNGIKVGVVNLVGRVFMDPAECPFQAVDALLPGLVEETLLVVVDFHAEATSEMVGMGWHLDGRVTGVVGTHTHVQTADEKVLPGGTAYLSDLGMTGPHDGIIGRAKEDVLYKFTTQMPTRFNVCEGDVRIQGAILTVDPETGRASAMDRVDCSVTIGAEGKSA